ncbi:zinc finger protein 429-like [Sitodiplosis mosellana]|uniref:zinc finger protein 429-like n=1 Tax=Sitodiplosis mosellana TaxID=263140 RepID=UPI0024441B9A|nr:zinc finger protein 429-like [Sitodiplosis mosellana]
MICLLCYEPNDELIAVNGKSGKQLNISKLLYKYFRIYFEGEPIDGELCAECWKNILAFNQFYIHIETIHDLINKTKESVTAEPVKIEFDEHNLKDEETFGDDDWSFHNDLDESDHDSTGPFTINATLPDDAINLPEIKQEANKKVSVKKEPKKASKSKKTVRGRPKPRSLFTCKIRMCLEEFDTLDALISHKTSAHRRIQCTHCPDLKLVVDLNKHLKNTHGILQNSMCEHCGQVYTNTRNLQDHIQRKHEVSQPLQCDICKEWFKSRDTIRAHMNYVHVQGPQACQICGKVSANRKALRKHQTIHMESWKDRFKCIICGRGFRDSTKLKEHSYIHSGVTDAYFCQFCGQSFRFGSSLSAHRMRYHPAEMAHVKDRLQRKKNLEFKV